MGKAAVNAGGLSMQLWRNLIILGCCLSPCHLVTASIARRSRGTGAAVLLYLIACRSPSKSFTSHPALSAENQNLSHGTAVRAGKLERQAGQGRTGPNIKMGGEHHRRPITPRLAGTIACRALRDPWPPATPRALQPTTLHDRALTCPPCCKPTATSRRCAASLDESQPRRGLPVQLPPCPALPHVPVCLRACVP